MKERSIVRVTLVLGLLALLVDCSWHSGRSQEHAIVIPAYVSAEARAVLEPWLEANGQYRLALDDECDCRDSIAEMDDWAKYHGLATLSYHPYYVVGDFNGDGIDDLAVVLADRKQGNQPSTLAVFNGPLGRPISKPAYFLQGLNMRGQGLFWGAPRPKPWILMYVDFATESDYGLFPRGDSYEYREGSKE